MPPACPHHLGDARLLTDVSSHRQEDACVSCVTQATTPPPSRNVPSSSLHLADSLTTSHFHALFFHADLGELVAG